MDESKYVEPEEFSDLSYQLLRAFVAGVGGSAFNDISAHPTKRELVAAVEEYGMPLPEVEEHAYRFAAGETFRDE